MLTTTAAAQYQPIPNFTGIGAGYNFRLAINQRFSGAQPILPRMVSYSFAGLPSEQDGTILWCKDCLRATPCDGGGAGAWAFGARGQWTCGNPPLEGDINLSGHSITNALGLKTQESGDTNFREGLVAGTGIQVGDGTSTPFTVIDESANLSASVNGRLNVEAPSYNAKGDGLTDNAAAIQNAYDAAAASMLHSWNMTPTLYLPATPGDNTCYKLSKPLILWAQVDVIGAGRASTALCPAFWGPDIIQQNNSGYKAPLTANVSTAWQAAHAYSTTYTEIVDSNGKIEYVSTAGTSGATAPTWCATGLGCTTTDGTVTWKQGPATTGGGILPGTGSAWDTSNSANVFGHIVQGLDLNWNPNANLNGLGAATVEFIVDPIYTFGNANLLVTLAGNPENSNAPAVWIQIDGSGNLKGIMDIGGSAVAAGSSSPLPLNQVDDIALTYDGTTVRLYLNGTLVGSGTGSGNITEGSYERMVYPAGDSLYQSAVVGGWYGSLRISNTARYTGTSYTPTTTQFASDANTLVLVNFPVPPTVGPGEAGYIEDSATSFGLPTYYPIDSSQNTQMTSRLSGLELCAATAGGSGGLYANWAVNSTWDHLNCSNGEYIGFDLNNNDYQVRVTNIYVSMQGAPKAPPSPINYFFGPQGNNNTYIDLQADGQAQTSFFQSGGYGTYINPMMTGRGASVYNFVNYQGSGIYIDPFTDIEGSEPNFKSSFYLNGTWEPVQISSPQLNAPAAASSPGDSFFTSWSGAPVVIIGGVLGGATAEITNFLSAPSSPFTIRDTQLPSGVALTNSGESYWLQGVIGAQNLGMSFADLPATPVNGAVRYCKDCDPPANPPVACTSAGTKTGAYAHGLNGAWICVP